MGHHRLDSVNDCARWRYNLRITCLRCGHVVEANAAEMLKEVALRKISRDLRAMATRMRCSKCRAKGARIMPVDATF